MGWAAAESLATGCGADRDRMTSVHSRSSDPSRWRHRIRAWGRVRLLRTIRPLEQGSAVGLARSRVGRISRPLTTAVSLRFVRVGAGSWPDLRRHALGSIRIYIHFQMASSF